MKNITLYQTRNGCFNSIPSEQEVNYFNSMTKSKQDNYLQDTFYNRGHGEGADNLIALSSAAMQFGYMNININVTSA